MQRIPKSTCSLFALSLAFAIAGCSTITASESSTVDACVAHDRGQFETYKAEEYKLTDGTDANSVALNFADCLGSPDPDLRDGIAYEGLAALLRSGRINDDTKRSLLNSLSANLSEDMSDPQGFLKPFSALVLAEVVRADRVEPYLNPNQRVDVVKTGAAYLRSITDYRGYDDKEGWRHGVAHTADLLMQLALNDNIGAAEHKTMLSAIAAQMSPQNVSYIYGEPGRLARPVLFMAAQEKLDAEVWTDWFSTLTDAAPFEGWANTYSSSAGLAKRHNTKAFLSSLYMTASMSENEGIKALLPYTIEAIRTVQ